MSYLAYAEYRQFGGRMAEELFIRAEYTARMYIDAATRNLLRDETPAREAVKMLVLELAERGYCGSLDGQDATSLGNDGVSVSLESSRGKAEALIKTFLANEEIGGKPLIPRAGIEAANVARV